MILSNADFLPRVFELLSYPDKRVRKEACWLISNLTAGNEAQIELIISNSQYLEALKKTLFQDIKEVYLYSLLTF